MAIFYEHLDTDILNELSFSNDKITPNKTSYSLAILDKSCCSDSIDEFDFYTVDSDYYIKSFCLKTNLHSYSIVLTELENIEAFDIESYGVCVKRVNNGFELEYGYYYCDEFNVFEDGGDIEEFYSYNEPLNQYIIDKMNLILAKASNKDNQLQALLKSKENAFDEYIKKEYSLKLKDFYKKNGYIDNYKLELESLLFDYLPDFNLYLEYRENFPYDFKNKRDILFEKYNFLDSFVNKCLFHEKLFDRLVNNLNSHEELMKYAHIVRDDYPNELMKSCENYLNSLNVDLMKAYKYHKITDVLKIMLSVKDCEDTVLKYVEYYRKEYPRRRNLMKLLDDLNI